MAIIKSIEEVLNVEITDHYGSFDGYQIDFEGESRSLSLLISNYQSCCESWGYFATDDALKDFVGANLTRLALVTSDDVRTVLLDSHDLYLDQGDAMFVEFWTDRGNFTLAAYNAHNGFYGHAVYLVSGKPGDYKEMHEQVV